jgi:hypothetical protein
MISTNDLRMLAKYQTIRTIRQSDGATLIANREVIDEKRPICWDVEENDPSWFKPPILRSEGPYSTTQLIKKAQEEGYGDWHPVPEDAEPDDKDYLVD